MSTSLFAITNAGLKENKTKKDWQRILQELKALKMGTTSMVNEKNQIVKEQASYIPFWP